MTLYPTTTLCSENCSRKAQRSCSETVIITLLLRNITSQIKHELKGCSLLSRFICGRNLSEGRPFRRFAFDLLLPARFEGVCFCADICKGCLSVLPQIQNVCMICCWKNVCVSVLASDCFTSSEKAETVRCVTGVV